MRNIVLLLIIPILIMGCKNKNGINAGSGTTDSVNSKLKEAVYVKSDSAIVPEQLYLSLDSIKIGAPFTDKADNYGYYRLLFSSSEETRSFHIEKIQVVGDGKMKLIKRFIIPTEVFGTDNNLLNIDFIKWYSPEIIEINVNGKKMKFDITKLNVVEAN